MSTGDLTAVSYDGNDLGQINDVSISIEKEFVENTNFDSTGQSGRPGLFPKATISVTMVQATGNAGQAALLADIIDQDVTLIKALVVSVTDGADSPATESYSCNCVLTKYDVGNLSMNSDGELTAEFQSVGAIT